jgi:hypothetical protein
MALQDAGDIAVTLVRASTRRFANTLRFNLSLRMVNHGRYGVYTGAVVMRVEAGGELRAPIQFPNDSLEPMTTANPSAVFDLPPNTTRAVLRTTIAEQTSEKVFDLK